MMFIRPVPITLGALSLTEYTGSKSELISSGIAIEDMFPSGRKRNRYSASEAGFNDYHAWATHRINGGKFKVKVWRRKERQLSKPEPWKNEADFRQHVISLAESMSEALIDLANGETDKHHEKGTISYRYNKASLQQLAKLSEEISRILSGGEIEHARPGKVIHFPIPTDAPT